VVKQLPDKEIAAKAKETLVMVLLREHQISQGKAAESLAISRHDLFDLMRKYGIPVIDLTPEELQAEIKMPFPRS
jgi:predicted HTH domain antitoxin